jgi:hypothetical protein
MPKKLLTTTIILTTILVLVVGIQAVEVVDANPVPWPSTPNQDKPTITVQTPQNNTVFAYNATDVWLNFTIAKPDSWTIQHLVTIPMVKEESVEAQLDGNTVYRGWSREKVAVKLDLNQSAPGLHTLNVTILMNSYYRGAAYNGSHIVSDIYSSSGPVYQYPWATSQIVYFTVEQPIPTPTPTNSDSSVNLSYFSAIVVVIAVVVVVSISLLYFKRRKGKP